MSIEYKILALKNRINIIENRGTAFKSPGVLRKLYRQLRNLQKQM